MQMKQMLVNLLPMEAINKTQFSCFVYAEVCKFSDNGKKKRWGIEKELESQATEPIHLLIPSPTGARTPAAQYYPTE